MTKLKRIGWQKLNYASLPVILEKRLLDSGQKRAVLDSAGNKVKEKKVELACFYMIPKRDFTTDDLQKKRGLIFTDPTLAELILFRLPFFTKWSNLLHYNQIKIGTRDGKKIGHNNFFAVLETDLIGLIKIKFTTAFERKTYLLFKAEEEQVDQETNQAGYLARKERALALMRKNHVSVVHV